VAADDYEPNGDMQIMEVSNEGVIYHRILHGNGFWDPWIQDPGGAQGWAVSIGIDGGGDLHVAMMGKDTVVYTRMRYTNGVWSGWQAVPGADGSPLHASHDLVALVVDRTGSTNGRVTLATAFGGGAIQLSYQNLGQHFAPAVDGPPAPPGEAYVSGLAAVLTHLTVDGRDSIVHLLAATYANLNTVSGQVYRWIAVNGTWSPPKLVPPAVDFFQQLTAAQAGSGGVALLAWG
jgi:hypothetical protein